VADVRASDQKNKCDDGDHDFQGGKESTCVIEGRLPKRPKADGATAIGGRIRGFETARNRGEFLLRLGQRDPRLQARVGFDPAGAAVFEFVAASLKKILHGSGDPKIHGPADESTVKTFRSDTDDGVNHPVEPLCLADDMRITIKPALPEPVADYDDRMRTLANVFSGKEAAAENGGHTDGVKVIRGNDAAGGALDASADAETGAGDFADKGGFAES